MKTKSLLDWINIACLSLALFILVFGSFEKTNHKKSINEIESLSKEGGMLEYKKAVIMFSLKNNGVLTGKDIDRIDSIYNSFPKK